MTLPALEVSHLKKRFGGLPATRDVSLSVMPGERRLIIGPNGAGKTTLFNLITGDLAADAGSIRLFGAGAARHADAAARAPRPGAHLSDPHAVSARAAHPQRGAVAARARPAALESVVDPDRQPRSLQERPRSAGARRTRRQRRAHRGRDLLRRAAPARTGHGAGAEAEAAPARRTARRTLPGRAPDAFARCSAPSRATSPS